jgi:Tfp pilus assembly pilus retraction ATPase PilT
MAALLHWCRLQGKLVVRHEKVKLPNVVDDVLELCQPLVGVTGSTGQYRYQWQYNE